MIDRRRLNEINELAYGGDDDVALQVESEIVLATDDRLRNLDDWVDEKLETMAFQSSGASEPADIDELAEDAGF